MRTLLVVGDIMPDTVVPLLEAQLRDLESGGARGRRAPRFPGRPPRNEREVYLIDKPGAPQSQIRIGWIGVARSTPDYFPIQVMNTILGGSFTSRLNMNLREKHGYTYGAVSVFDMRASARPVLAAAGVQTDKTSESLKEFFNELNGIQQPVPADELARAKNYVALRFPGRLRNDRRYLAAARGALVYRLPDDYFSRYVHERHDASRAARRAARRACRMSVPGKVVGRSWWAIRK